MMMTDYGMWLELIVGLVGIIGVGAFAYLLPKRAGVTQIPKLGVWLGAVFVWALSMFQAGFMNLYGSFQITMMIHQALMALGVILALASLYAIYRSTDRSADAARKAT
jgi:hypothetical protein